MQLYSAMSVALSSRFISYPDLAIISKTSCDMHRAVSQIISLRVNDVLRRWLDPGSLFWSTLEETRAVVGGATALRVIDDPCHLWVPQALDFYVQRM